MTPDDISDLENALAQQSHKRGRFDTTHVGRWNVHYTDFFGKDEFPSEMLQHWFHLLQAQELEGTGTVKDMAFEWGMGDKRNIMIASKGSA